MRRNALTILQKFFGKGSFFFTLNLQREVDGKLVFIDNYLTLLDAFEADPLLKRQYYDGEIIVQYVAEYTIGDKNIIVAVGDTREDCYKPLSKTTLWHSICISLNCKPTSKTLWKLILQTY